MARPIGPEKVIVNHQYPYFLEMPIMPGVTILWTITGGQIVSGQGTQQIVVLWTEVGNGTVQVSVTHQGQGPIIDSIVVVVDPDHVNEN